MYQGCCGIDFKKCNLEYGIYGIDLKMEYGMWNMECPKSWNLWNFWNGISQIMEFY
jgi:hypothetical protein